MTRPFTRHYTRKPPRTPFPKVVVERDGRVIPAWEAKQMKDSGSE